jgi:hypothetical protein
MDWHRFECPGTVLNDLARIIGLNGLTHVEWIGMDWHRLAWNGVVVNGLAWVGIGLNELAWTGIGLDGLALF